MTKRTLEQAMANAKKVRVEIPQLVQPEVSAYDLVLLADEVLRLQKEVETFHNEEHLLTFVECGHLLCVAAKRGVAAVNG